MIEKTDLSDKLATSKSIKPNRMKTFLGIGLFTLGVLFPNIAKGASNDYSEVRVLKRVYSAQYKEISLDFRGSEAFYKGLRFGKKNKTVFSAFFKTRENNKTSTHSLYTVGCSGKNFALLSGNDGSAFLEREWNKSSGILFNNVKNKFTLNIIDASVALQYTLSDADIAPLLRKQGEVGVRGSIGSSIDVNSFNLKTTYDVERIMTMHPRTLKGYTVRCSYSF
ncbi:MAG: hypothetical protein ABIC91_08490 [Nanoarchaeota archaeon]|nr:hypothetical protein [Nanoarchaeota archaeon]MBU1030326.1 hypothetical protein [Nanoarchaeota archaeon]MBU1849095.1 hypothetical protein [Nanoarchaeota archaeon]